MNNLYGHAFISPRRIDELAVIGKKFLTETTKEFRPTPRDLYCLQKFLESRVFRSMEGTRIDFLDEDLRPRFLKMGKIRNSLTNLGITSSRIQEVSFWCFGLVAEMTQIDKLLGDLSGPTRYQTATDFQSFLEDMPRLIQLFIENPTDEREDAQARNMSEKNKAIERDGGVCTLTGSNVFEVCHIVPFWTVIRPTLTRTCLRRVGVLFGAEFSEAILRATSNVGNRVDTASNMLCLDPKLHKYMDKGLFGLEPLDYVTKQTTSPSSRRVTTQWTTQLPSTPTSVSPAADPAPADLSTSRPRAASDPVTATAPAIIPVGGHEIAARITEATGPEARRTSERLDNAAKKRKHQLEEEEKSKKAAAIAAKEKESLMHGIRLRFHWLPATEAECLWSKMSDPNAHPRDMWKKWDVLDNIFNSHTCRPLDTGEVITIWARNKSELPSWDFLKLQWAAFRIHRLAGGAGPAIYGPLDDEDPPGRGYSLFVEDDTFRTMFKEKEAKDAAKKIADKEAAEEKVAKEKMESEKAIRETLTDPLGMSSTSMAHSPLARRPMDSSHKSSIPTPGGKPLVAIPKDDTTCAGEKQNILKGKVLKGKILRREKETV